MCLRNVYYPLCNLENGKRKLLFKYGVKVVDRTTFEGVAGEKDYLVEVLQKPFKDLRTYQYLKENEVVGVEKMVQIPCGCCRECLTESSRQWAFRIMKEAEQHEDNWFITFTYDDDHITQNMMLDKDVISDFNKRLKIYLSRKGLKSDFRFYAVGEYGGKTARPHYHVIYFGLSIPDLKFVCKSKEGNFIFDSQFIKHIWKNGFITIEGVTVGSACYVARYCDKKKKNRLNKSQKEEMIKKGIVPEFARMSNRPGIGGAYMEQALERFQEGKFVEFIAGKSFSYPLYYNRKIKEILSDSDILKQYEEYSRLKSVSKIFENLELSDRVVDLQSYYDQLDKEVQKRGKL